MKILVVKLSSLGDLFHALPTVRAVRAGLGARVDWVTQPAYAELVRCFDDVERVLVFPRRGGLAGGPAFLRELRRERYDLILDLQGLLKSALVARLTRGGRRLGPSFHREGARLLYHAVAGPRNKERHAVEEILDTVRLLDLPVPDPVFPVHFPRRELAAGHPRIALIPRSRWPAKNWPVPNFIAAASALREKTGATFFLVGALEDRAAGGAIAQALGAAAVDLCGKTSLVELGSLLHEMDLVLTVDTGPMHLAAALGRPVLALFGPTDPRRTGPYGPRHRVLTAEDLACRPCYADTCRNGQLDCMAGITPECVVATALEMLHDEKPQTEG
ncbi:MAG: glycosyltransferase family 9 protein [Kiritimatiellaeota bacterium]|nr:glycosyltransferase family 9 protein [Kiritimatiellota bacterium]